MVGCIELEDTASVSFRHNVWHGGWLLHTCNHNMVDIIAIVRPRGGGMILYKICRWFWELGQVYTWTDYANDVRDVRLRDYIATKQMNEIMSKLVFE